MFIVKLNLCSCVLASNPVKLPLHVSLVTGNSLTVYTSLSSASVGALTSRHSGESRSAAAHRCAAAPHTGSEIIVNCYRIAMYF